jgi:hypothetical protein
MSEKIAPTDDNLWDFPRISPVIDVQLAGKERKLHFMNTMLYTFVGHWATVDHVFVTADNDDDPNDPNIYSFNCREMINHLKELNFPNMMMPFPSNNDLKAYSEFMAQELSNDLEEL